MFNSEANYQLIGENKKPQTQIAYDKIPSVKDILMQILEEDYQYWTNKKLKQMGIERFNLLKKVSEKIKINSNVFDLALEELETEFKIIPYCEGSFKRFIKVSF